MAVTIILLFIEPDQGSVFYSHDLRTLRIRLLLFNPSGILYQVNNNHQRIKIRISRIW